MTLEIRVSDFKGVVYRGTAKDCGLNRGKNWFSTRFLLGKKRFYSRLDATLVATSADQNRLRMAEDNATLAAHGFNPDTLEIL